MPRIDKALARARTGDASVLPPTAAAATESPDVPEFPSEPEAHPAAPDVFSGAHAEASGPAGDEQTATPAVLRPVTDLTRLPLAEKLVPSSPHSSCIEQYRRLAARLYLLQAERRTSVIMVTSAVPGEGKTLTAANLALTLSESYRRSVLLVDADLRRPWMHQVFGVPNLTGLNDALRAESDRKVPLIQLTDNLTLLPAGRPEADPMSVLSSDRMRRVLDEAGTKFEWVVIDTPPVGLLTDAHLLSSLVDTVLLVIEAGRTPLASVKAAIQAIGRDRILGVVLNRAEGSSGSPYYYYDHYAEASTAQKTV